MSSISSNVKYPQTIKGFVVVFVFPCAIVRTETERPDSDDLDEPFSVGYVGCSTFSCSFTLG